MCINTNSNTHCVHGPFLFISDFARIIHQRCILHTEDFLLFWDQRVGCIKLCYRLPVIPFLLLFSFFVCLFFSLIYKCYKNSIGSIIIIHAALFHALRNIPHLFSTVSMKKKKRAQKTSRKMNNYFLPYDNNICKQCAQTL